MTEDTFYVHSVFEVEEGGSLWTVHHLWQIMELVLCLNSDMFSLDNQKIIEK